MIGPAGAAGAPKRGALAVAAVCAAAGFVAGIARASGPDVVPEVLWWRGHEPLTLAAAPLRVWSGGERFALSTEWRPLYADHDGTRFESASRTVRFGSPLLGSPEPHASEVGIAFELAEEGGIARGGGAARWIGAERTHVRRATGGFAARHGRVSLAASVSASEFNDPGWAWGGRARVAGGWTASIEDASTVASGSVEARWNDVGVRAPGAWIDHTRRVGLDGAGNGWSARIGFEGLDRRPRGSGSLDVVATSLAWRDVDVGGSADFTASRWSARARHGRGWQRQDLSRARASYGAVAGPLERTDFQVATTPLHGGWTAKLAAGRWSGEAAGALALWPFEELGATLGTRMVARSSAVLRHAGISWDRLPGPGSAWDAGIAVSRLAPSARVRSWRSTIAGLGRDHSAQEDADVRAVWLAGLRGAVELRAAGTRARLECVQWLPVRVERERPSGGAIGAPGAPSPGDSGSQPSGRGGTIVRFSIRG